MIIALADFGISKVLEKTDQFATTVTGTPYYMVSVHLYITFLLASQLLFFTSDWLDLIALT